MCTLPNMQAAYARQSSLQEEARAKFSSVLIKDSLGEQLMLRR